jgi:hypothetical protein
MRHRLAWLAWFTLALLAGSLSVDAHPMVEDALDVVVSPDRIVIDARISMEQVLVAGAAGGAAPPRERWIELCRLHGEYVRTHLRVRADGHRVEGRWIADALGPPAPTGATSLVPYRFEYAMPRPPNVVKVDQSFLREFESWTASCVVRARQSDDPQFASTFLTREGSVEIPCQWKTGAIAKPAAGTTVPVWLTIRQYTREGIRHILTGYDHLLFVSALVLAATRWWDLFKVVTAFTIAHTLTLILSVLDKVSLPEHVVEPMIAASIVFVALQNIFWPRQSRGWTRLAVAFSFGLFHGLGFAGGLKTAMAGMPRIGLWTALCSFSAGVEIGHQVVVLPLFGILSGIRHWNAAAPSAMLMRRVLKIGSAAISVAGVYFLVHALR